MMTPSPSRLLDIVIVNWNSGEALAACLASLAGISDLESVVSVVVVDNASSDGSDGALMEADPSLPLAIRRNQKNLGFGAGCNQGAAPGTAPYLLFLNPDTDVQDGALTRVLEFLEATENQGYGIAGGPLREPSGKVSRTCARFPTPGNLALQSMGLDRLPWIRRWGRYMREWDHRSTRRVDQIMGAFLFIRRSVFQSLGGFDERFFVYWEDVDLCRRAASLGQLAAFVQGPGVVHEGGVSSGTVKDLRLFYSLRSRIQYGRKHFLSRGARMTEFVARGVEIPLRSLRARLKGDSTGASGVKRAATLLDEWLLANPHPPPPSPSPEVP
ncbi:MAG: glycosyltransferase family 2 protein [Gemmatimonadota bacterium]